VALLDESASWRLRKKTERDIHGYRKWNCPQESGDVTCMIRYEIKTRFKYVLLE
jgi:hypothetical protein